MTWLSLSRGRLTLRLHVLLPVAVAALWLLFGGDLSLRYLLLLATLLVHEFGHAAAALALGSRQVRVRVWPVFGRADVETFPDRRLAWVALSGPALNLLLAAALLAGGARFGLHLRHAPLLDFLLTVNLLMGLGNLLPVPGLDGGRALAAILRK